MLAVVRAHPRWWAKRQPAGSSRPISGFPLQRRLGRLRRAAIPLLTLAIVTPLLGVPTAYAAEGPLASFGYTMPDRFGLDENGDGLTDYVAGTTDHPGPVQVNPSSWHVDLDACASTDGAALSWRVVDQPDPTHPLTVTRSGEECDDFDLEVPVEGTYRVALTATKDGVSTTTTVPVVVQDWLIVSLGDSDGSGEGTPDVEIPQDELRGVPRGLARLRHQDPPGRHGRGRPRAAAPAGGAVAALRRPVRRSLPARQGRLGSGRVRPGARLHRRSHPHDHRGGGQARDRGGARDAHRRRPRHRRLHHRGPAERRGRPPGRRDLRRRARRHLAGQAVPPLGPRRVSAGRQAPRAGRPAHVGDLRAPGLQRRERRLRPARPLHRRREGRELQQRLLQRRAAPGRWTPGRRRGRASHRRSTRRRRSSATARSTRSTSPSAATTRTSPTSSSPASPRTPATRRTGSRTTRPSATRPAATRSGWSPSPASSATCSSTCCPTSTRTATTRSRARRSCGRRGATGSSATRCSRATLRCSATSPAPSPASRAATASC